MGKRALIGIFVALSLPAAARADDLAATAQAAISQYRAQHGLAPVAVDAQLMALAAEQARAMARTGTLDHSVDRPFEARIVRYEPDIAVENIAAGTKDFPATLNSWERSPRHDANLRRDGVTRFGIASAPAPDSRYKIFWSLIMAGKKPHHGLRQAGGPGVLQAPAQGPAVRVRSEPKTQAAASDLFASVKSGVKKLLSPLW